MANFNNKLTLTTTEGHTYDFGYSADYEDVFEIRQNVDNTDTFINLLSIAKGKAAQSLNDVKGLVIANEGAATAEVQIKFQGWENSSDTDIQDEVAMGGGSAAEERYATFLLPPNEYTYFSNIRFCGYDDATSAANAGDGLVTNVDPADINSGSEFADSGINLGADLENTETAITVADLAPFRVGDLVQVGINNTTATKIEIMRVTAMSGTDGSGTLTVERALYGTAKADKDAQTDSTNGAVNGANVHFPFFNAYHKFDMFSTAQTDGSGRFKIHNFFGKFRTDGAAGSGATGIVAGSFSMKFYEAGYSKFNLTGVTLAQSTGLSASTTYKFATTIDGSSADTFTITTDSSDVSWGNVLNKMQTAVNALYYSGTNTKGKSAFFSIVDGDVRYTSGSRLTVSATTLVNSDGTDPFGVGRFPADDSLTAVAARLPDDTEFDNKSFTENPNSSAFAYDDGHGNILGAAEGSISYETGKLDITSAPANSNFVVSANGNSAHSGGVNATATFVNTISSIKARSVNQKVNTTVRLVAVN